MGTQLATTGPDGLQKQVVEKPLMSLLGRYKGQIETVLPKHMTPERVLKLIVGAINRNPKLLECTPMSVVNCVLTAATLGLEIRPNQAYLVPFKGVCTLLIDYRGKIELAIRSGKVKDIVPYIVYGGDKFNVKITREGSTFEHEPLLFKRDKDGMMLPVGADDRGKMVLVYAIATLEDGTQHLEWMTKADVDHIRSKSRAKDDGPWVTDYDEMAKKTMIHRISKNIPNSPELAKSQEIDDKFEMNEALDPVINMEAPEDTDDKPFLPAGSKEAAAEVAERKIAEGNKGNGIEEWGFIPGPEENHKPGARITVKGKPYYMDEECTWRPGTPK